MEKIDTVAFPTSDYPISGGLNVSCGSLNKTKGGSELICCVFCHWFNAVSEEWEEKTEQHLHHVFLWHLVHQIHLQIRFQIKNVNLESLGPVDFEMSLQVSSS